MNAACSARILLACAGFLWISPACGGDDDGGGQRDGGGGGGDDGGAIDGGGGEAEACAETTPVERAPECGAGPTSSVNLPSGCAPNVDGTLHMEEWDGATCFNVGDAGDVIYAKFAGDAVYLAFSATPSCGCPMAFAFDPDAGDSFDGDEFGVMVFDDPFNPDGDRSEGITDGDAWVEGSAPAGIVTACPGAQPDPINYEWRIPFSALGITAGAEHTFGIAVNHPLDGVWPEGITLEGTMPVDAGEWGRIGSPSGWQ